MLFQSSFDGPHPTQVLLQFCFGVPISFVERFHGVFEIVKLAELVRDSREDKGHGASNRLFTVSNDPFDRNPEGLHKVLDVLEESGDISLRAAEERSRQEDFFGQALT